MEYRIERDPNVRVRRRRGGWRSIFPAAEAHKSSVHSSVDVAMFYMVVACGVPADQIEIPPITLVGT